MKRATPRRNCRREIGRGTPTLQGLILRCGSAGDSCCQKLTAQCDNSPLPRWQVIAIKLDTNGNRGRARWRKRDQNVVGSTVTRFVDAQFLRIKPADGDDPRSANAGFMNRIVRAHGRSLFL